MAIYASKYEIQLIPVPGRASTYWMPGIHSYNMLDGKPIAGFSCTRYDIKNIPISNREKSIYQKG